MHKRAETTQSGTWRIIIAALVLCLGIGTTQAIASVNTSNNNLTVTASDGSQVGGENSISFTWDGTRKTAVAAFGQVSNATITSSCPFFGHTWAAHDVAIYGPGTYTIYNGCAAGSPGCGTGDPVTFTVGTGQLGGHMLLDWSSVTDNDIVNVWAPNSIFGPSPLWTGACDSNAADKIWDLMSTDWDSDGINGAPMMDGPFNVSSANFNLMVCGNCDDGDPCTIDTCDTDDGACVHTPVVCPGGTCYSLMGCIGDLACPDDHNVCTTDSFMDPATGTCSYTNNTSACDDGDACTENDTCAGGACAGTAKSCNDGNVCATDSCDPTTGNCVFTNNATACDDGNACTTGDFCVSGVCVSGSCIEGCGSSGVDTTGNNFSMLDSQGITFGGTNDVHFTWDGSKKTSVAVSGQVSNASISTSTPFFGYTWATTDVAIYGPGTYTVYTDCPPGSPGCGLGASYTVTVGEGELGAHILFNWGAPATTTSCGVEYCDIDIVNIWTPGKAFSPSLMWTGAGGSNSAGRVWDLMSKDWDGDGINGATMVDGPFVGTNANFNVMGSVCRPEQPHNRPPTEPTLVSPADQATELETTVEFRWKLSIDPDGDAITYLITYCTNSNLTDNCKSNSDSVESRTSKGAFYAGATGLLMIGFTFVGGSRGRRWSVLLLVLIFVVTGGMFCPHPHPYVDEMSYTATGLSTGVTYYWKVAASDGKVGGTTGSTVQSFTTRQ